MPSHYVDTEFQCGIDHVLASCPQRRGRTLPGIATIEQQCARAIRLQLFHQCSQVGEAADLAEFARGVVEIEVRECVSFGASRPDPEVLQQFFSYEVRGLARRTGHAEIHVWLAKVDRLQLRVTVGHVQKVYVAESRQIVKAAGAASGRECCRAIKLESACARDGERVQELAAIHVRHLSNTFLKLYFISNRLDTGFSAGIVGIATWRTRYRNRTQQVSRRFDR